MSRAYLGTPGVVSSVILQHAFGHALVIDRKADKWDRCPEGDGRFAVMLEPRRRYTTMRSLAKAREEQARVSELRRVQIEALILGWKTGQ